MPSSHQAFHAWFSAIEDPNPEVAGQGHAKLRAAGITVDIGLCAAEAARDHAGHFRRIRDRARTWS